MPDTRTYAYVTGAGVGLGVLIAYLLQRYAGRNYKNDLIDQGNAAIASTTDTNLQKSIQDANLDYAEITKAEWAIAAGAGLGVAIAGLTYTKQPALAIIGGAVVTLLIIHYAQKSDERKLRALISASGVAVGDPGKQAQEYMARQRQSAGGVARNVNRNVSGVMREEAYDIKGPAQTAEKTPPAKDIDSNLNGMLLGGN